MADADAPQCSGAIDAWDPEFGSIGLVSLGVLSLANKDPGC